MEIEDVELAGFTGDGVDGRPSTRNQVNDSHEPDDSSSDIDGHLDDICPYDGSHSTFEGVDERKGSDNGDSCNVASEVAEAGEQTGQRDPDNNRNGEDADAFGRGTRDEK